MGELHRFTVALAAAGMVFAAPMAQAVPFTITSASFTPGSGYGEETNEKNGTLLDVLFSTSGFSTQSFTLNAAGNAYTFNFGTVTLREPDAHGGISTSETDNLDVTAALTFTSPLGLLQDIMATGIATVGSVSDSSADFVLNWNPVSVEFFWEDWAGVFDINLASLSLSNQDVKTQTAKISLRELSRIQPEAEPLGDQPGSNQPASVPEPGMFALLGLGLMGLAFSRRRQVA